MRSSSSSRTPKRLPKTRRANVPLYPVSCATPLNAFESPFPKSMRNVCWTEYRTIEERMAPLIDWFSSYLAYKVPTVCGPTVVVDLDDSAFLGADPETQKANPLIRAIVKLAASRNCYVAFVTARPSTSDAKHEDANMKMTIDQIKRLGYDSMYHRLLMSKADDENWQTHDYALEKKQHRDRLRSEGKTILINIGDQWTDHFASPDYDRLESDLVVRYERTKILIFENDLEGPERSLCVKLPESEEALNA